MNSVRQTGTNLLLPGFSPKNENLVSLRTSHCVKVKVKATVGSISKVTFKIYIFKCLYFYSALAPLPSVLFVTSIAACFDKSGD